MDLFFELAELSISGALEGVHVLVAEDGVDNQRLIKFFLTKAGADVRIVDNGQKAIDAISEANEAGSQYHVVLMDMQMPVLDGFSATAQLRESGCTLPVIALTAHAMESDRAQCIEAGCDEHLAKPIDRAKLISVCARWAHEQGDSQAAA